MPGAGIFVRSAGIGASLADFKEDAERLTEAWQPVIARRQSARAPATLYHDLDPVERTMRDEVDAQTSRVLIDDAHAFEAARAYCRRAMPEGDSRSRCSTGPACCSICTTSKKRSNNC